MIGHRKSPLQLLLSYSLPANLERHVRKVSEQKLPSRPMAKMDLARYLIVVGLLLSVLSSLIVCGNAAEARPSNQSQSSGDRQLKVALMGMQYGWYGPPFFLWSLGSALPLAFDDVLGDANILPNHTTEIVVQDSACNPVKAVGEFVRLVQEEGVDAIIGPACGTACEAVGYLASAWNIPVVSYACGSLALSDKVIFSTFMRTTMALPLVAYTFENILNGNDWATVGILHDTYYVFYQMVIDYMEEIYPDRNITVKKPEYYNSEEGTVPIENLERLGKVCRGEVDG